MTESMAVARVVSTQTAAESASLSPTAIQLPAATNPTYPGCPWYALPTGRRDAAGAPLYGFVSRGIMLGWVDRVEHGGHTLRIDPTLWELGALSIPYREGTESYRPDTPANELPAWARASDGSSILHAEENGPFLAAMMKQLGPEIARRLNFGRGRFPDGPARDGTYRASDIHDVEVSYVANYGQTQGRTGNGRRVAIRYTVDTAAGPRRFRSDISDPLYTDPTTGGLYGFRDATGTYRGHRPVDHVLAVRTDELERARQPALESQGQTSWLTQGLAQALSAFRLRP